MTSLEINCNIHDIIKCVDFAAKKHKQQKRKDAMGTPYINHPIGVAYILTEEAGVTDSAVIKAALLHDTVEDTATTIDEIKEVFGDEIAGIVNEVTDDKSLDKMTRKLLQIEHAPHTSHKAKLVKLADKLYNLRDLTNNSPPDWSADRVQEYFAWAAQVVKGLRGTNQQMEDLLDEMFVKKGVLDLAK